MVMAFPKYESYKDSGEDWIGEVPKHWDVLRTKNVFRLVAEPAPKNNDEELLSVYSDIGVKPRRELEERGNKASTTDGYWIVKKGDVIVNKLLAWMGAIGVSDYDGVTSPAYDILRARKPIDSKFYHYLFRTQICIDKLKKHSKGIMEMRLRLYFDEFGNIKIPYPSIEEQNRIVDFLDRITSDIDQAIAKKQRLIELLNEQKAILINRAVTKGLNPNVPMRDSGIEWIGEIPEHWGVCSLSYIANLTAGGTPDRSRPQYWNGGIPWIKTGEVNYNTIISAEEHISAIGLRNSSAKIAPPDTILMAMYGQGVTRGRVAILGIEAAFNQACLAISPSGKLQVKYLYYYLQSAYRFTRDTGNETSQMNLSSGSIGKIKIVIPSNEEQTLISKFLDQKTIEIDEVLSKQLEIIKGLNLLKESFISEAVTGKIKV